MIASSSLAMRSIVLSLLLVLPLSSCDLFGGSDEACPIEGTAPATPTSTVTVDYVGQLEDGPVFDQNLCATFNLQDVVVGFREGIVGKVPNDEQFVFTVPPEKGYGTAARPGIPPNSTLVFTVRLRSVE